jgi:PPK2 family polyphosphate:nucleotide phosphotransferase
VNGLIDAIRVQAGTPARLLERDAAARIEVGGKEAGVARLAERISELSDLQNRLWAEGERSLLLVLQGLDASGKDGTIRSVFTGVNPQGTRVTSFKVPSETERAHDFLWRIHAVCPAHGEIGIFNRSHYEDLVTVWVKEIGGRHDRAWWKARVRAINEFERTLSVEGTTIVKVFLHVSKEEQGRRFQERMTDPAKAWKFRMGDLEDRSVFDEFMAGYDRAITETSTAWAPWHVVPADRNWMRNLAVAELLVSTLDGLDLHLPPPPIELANGALVVP